MSTPIPPVSTVTLTAPGYPDRVRALEAPPPRITIAGSLAAGLVVAIVGSRTPTPEAAAFAHALAVGVVGAGGVVASGGAVGVDAAAHRGALAASGRTWCVAPTGRHRTFPAEHKDLFATIVSRGGAMVWPFPDDAETHRGNFFLRNSVLAALADVLVIVQAAAPSGALNAALHARKLGRPIWVVAGAPWDARFTGCLAEIDRGAHVITSVDTFLASVGGVGPGLAVPTHGRGARKAAASGAARMREEAHGHSSSISASALTLAAASGAARVAPAPPPRDPVQRSLFEATSTAPRHVDEIAARARVCASTAATALLTLALENVVVEGPGGFYRRAGDG